MITHTVASELPVTAEQFWAEYMHGVQVESNDWPRSITERSSGFVAKALVRTRTVSRASAGCKVVDQLSIEARARLLRPWLIAVRLMEIKRFHSALRVRYGLRGY